MSALRSGPIVGVPGLPAERAGRMAIDEILYVQKAFGVTLTDAFGSGHHSPGHTVYGDAADFWAADNAKMGRAVGWLTKRGYTVYYDGSNGSTALHGHGPNGSAIAAGQPHFHVELHSGPGDQGLFAGKPGAKGPGVGFKVFVPNSQIPQGGSDNATGGVAGPGVKNAVDAAGSLLDAVKWVFSGKGVLTIAFVVGGAALALTGVARTAGVHAPRPSALETP